MRKRLLFLLTSVFTVLTAFGQTIDLNGSVIDTSTHEGLTNATVCLLYAKDSIMTHFTRVGKDGKFSLKGVDTGKYVLLVSYPEYADYVEKLTVDGQTAPDLNKITMVQKAHLLEDVIVQQKIAAIQFKGDTTEFNADSFRTQPNANVEDLLKILPGLQVDQDGKITAQGETVTKVLVDGEEFFGDDPTLVTKNLRADMVDKVQLFDKTSDQAAFTGIDDGEKEKTLNIKLKADKKNGYFGKVSGGIGTEDFYESQGMFNYFKAKKKFSVYGTFGNTGKIGLGFQDAMKYGARTNNLTIMDGGGLMISGGGGGDDPLSSFSGNYDGHGIPTAKTGGVHYDSKWDEDQQSLNLNYKIGGMSVKGANQTTLQQNLDEGVLYTNTDDAFKKRIFRQKLDGEYEVKFDTSSTLKINVGGSISNNSTHDDYNTETRRGVDRDTLVNQGTRQIDNEGDDKAFTANVLWMKKLKKKGRTFSLNATTYQKNSDMTGFLKSDYDYYKDNAIDSSAIIDQMKTSNTKTSNLDVKATYTEPLSKRTSLVLNYGISSSNSNSDLKSFNSDGSNYTDLDSLYSNHYEFNQFAHQGGAAISYKHLKTNFNIGTNVAAVKYSQKDLYAQQTLKRNFLNWNPTARFTYKFSRSKSFRISYNGNTQQPSLSQIQPVRNNNDNQNIYIGNPDLKPSFNNRFNISFNDYKLLTQRYIGMYGGYTLTMKPIVTNVSTNLETGRSIFQYLNLDQNTSNYYGGLYYNRKVEKLWGISVGGDLGIRGSKYVNMTNDVENISNSNNYNFSLSFRKYEEKKYSFRVNLGASYTSNKTTLQSQIDNNYWSYNIRPNVDIFLPAKFQIHTDLDYDYQAETESFDARNQTIWNAWIGKKFFKKENLLLKVSAHDILDQNKGFSRNAYNNNISQNYYTTIHRYFMLSLVWNFSKMGGTTNSK